MTDRPAANEFERADAAPPEMRRPHDHQANLPVATSPSARRGARRVSRWDRPPDPHDWRFFVGMLGRVLIVTGLLLFGFVAYQLWGTGIETARAQNALEDEFATMVAENEPVTTQPTPTPPTATQPTATQPTATQPDAEPVATTPDTAPTADTEPAAPTSAPPTTAVQQVLPPVERGQALARLEIPKIGKTGGNALYVVPGVTRDDLKQGPGHYPDTPLPGQLGNASIAGHRTTYGEPFRHVDDLESGDEMIVTMANGEVFVYDVTGIQVVGASDSWVVATTDPTVANLTLTSCHPVGTARDRIIVSSVLNPEKSGAVGVPTYYELDETDAEPIDFDDPSVASEPSDLDDGASNDPVVGEPTVDENTVDENTVDENAVDENTVDTSDDGDDVAAATADGNDPAGVDPALDPTLDPTAGDDAFEEGWFDDPSAWPQIIVWGTVLVLISVGAYLISRHFRRYSVGFLVGVAPFLFCLYFFYQNVNRLLPPGL